AGKVGRRAGTRRGRRTARRQTHSHFSRPRGGNARVPPPMLRKRKPSAFCAPRPVRPVILDWDDMNFLKHDRILRATGDAAKYRLVLVDATHAAHDIATRHEARGYAAQLLG